MTDQSAVATLIGALEDPAIWVTPDRQIDALNPAAEDLLGRGLVGLLVRSVIRQPEPVEALERGFDALAKLETRVFTAAMLRSNTLRESSWHMRVATVCNGIRGLLITFGDRGQIEAAEQQRRDFVANVSHELRSPLTVLTGFIDTLRGPARDDPKARDQFLDIMEREAARMNRLVDDLLSLSRVEADQRVRPRAQVDLAEILRATLAALRPQIETSGVTLVDKGVEGAIRLHGDRDQLIQVFRNLIENAMKYGKPAGRIELDVRHHERAPGFPHPVVEVAVRDEGEGIDAIHLPRLTERFYRVDTHRSRERGGTGLGLAIVKHIVHRHRGRLSVTSVVGEGSRFAVLLPLG